MALDAVIFDLDGTLVDTNGTHTRAWRQAFERFSYVVGEDRIALEIGKGGSLLVPAVVGEAAEEKYGDALRDAHDEIYLDLTEKEGIDIFPDVRRLLEAVHARGLKAAIATAAKQESLEKVMEVAGLNLDELADAVVTDTDVEESKPAPDVVQAAVSKLGLSPAQCAMVGDTPYDVEAARRAGVVTFGVLTGVHDAETMRRAGARATYAAASDLLDHLDDALSLASPGAAHLTWRDLEALMAEALDEARRALDEGNVPIGSVLADGHGTILAQGRSRTEETGNFLLHAEMVAFENALGQVPSNKRDTVLVTTLEPCVMCYGAAMSARVDTILYALEAPFNGGTGRCTPMHSPGMVTPRVIGGVGREKSRELLAAWRQRTDSPFAEKLMQEV